MTTVDDDFSVPSQREEAGDRTALLEIETQIASMVDMAVMVGIENEPRTLQARSGQLGPSDIGFCRQKAALTAKGVSPTDSTNMWAATIGTAIHKHIEGFLKDAYGDTWIVEGKRVTAHLPGANATISGTPDLILPDFNAIFDIKTVDGLEKVKNYGPSQNHLYQRHLYAMGALAEGLLDPSRQVYVGNIFIDVSRSNTGESKVWVTVAPMDEALTDEIDLWVEDVVYAMKYNEDASRDIAPAICERICPFFTVCRGALPARDNEPLQGEEILQAVDMYVKGRDMAKVGDAMKKEAAAVLTGLNGSTGEWQVRTTTINAQDVPGYTRKASVRLDVRKVRKT